MKIAIGSDRCGFLYKGLLVDHLRARGYELVDVGTHEEVPSDSPYFAARAVRLVASGECGFGVLLCATGTGMEIAANIIPGVMCCIYYNVDVARLARDHNDCNKIAFGQDHMGYSDVERCLDAFLEAPFGGREHYANRVEQIRALERGESIEPQPARDGDWGQELRRGLVPVSNIKTDWMTLFAGRWAA